MRAPLRANENVIAPNEMREREGQVRATEQKRVCALYVCVRACVR